MAKQGFTTVVKDTTHAINSAIKDFTSITQTLLPDGKASVLLIGSTGNGKSALGNFLLDPDETQPKQFETATDNLPKTQNSLGRKKKIHDVLVGRYSSLELTVIDTPGLNENAEKDLKHMIDVITELQKVKEITACIFVVKFNAKIDAQYKATIEYYAKLLPSLIEKNIFIVMTDYATDKRSVALRKKQDINVEQMKSNVIKEIVKHAKLHYDNPITFMIDSVPFSEPEKATSMKVRAAIIDYIMSLQPIAMKDLMVAKTKYLLTEDREKIKEYEGTITGYKQRLQQSNNRARKVLDEVHQKESEVADLSIKIKSLKSEVGERDTKQLVTAATWSVETEWRLFKIQEKLYKLESPWPICNVRKWTNEKCELQDTLSTPYKLEGIARGRFMGGVYASVTLETEMREKYAKQIKELNDKLAAAEAIYAEQKKELKHYSDKHHDYLEEIELFECFIELKKDLIVKLSQDKMNIDEAHEALERQQKMRP